MGKVDDGNVAPVLHQQQLLATRHVSALKSPKRPIAYSDGDFTRPAPSLLAYRQRGARGHRVECGDPPV